MHRLWHGDDEDEDFTYGARASTLRQFGGDCSHEVLPGLGAVVDYRRGPYQLIPVPARVPVRGFERGRGNERESRYVHVGMRVNKHEMAWHGIEKETEVSDEWLSWHYHHQLCTRTALRNATTCMRALICRDYIHTYPARPLPAVFFHSFFIGSGSASVRPVRTNSKQPCKVTRSCRIISFVSYCLARF